MKGSTYIDWDDVVTVNGMTYVRVEFDKAKPLQRQGGRSGSPLKFSNMPWTEQQDAELLAALSRHESPAYVAKQMGRTRIAVSSRIHTLKEKGRVPKN